MRKLNRPHLLTISSTTVLHTLGGPACFRVMVRRADSTVDIVALARTGQEAVELAKQVADAEESRRRKAAGAQRPKARHRANGARACAPSRRPGPNRVTAVYTETWLGTQTAGEWKALPADEGGFFQKIGSFQPDRCHETAVNFPRSGERVECELLPDKTRKGGWKARICKHGLVGPITNTSAVPPAAQPSQIVSLRIGSISRERASVQFEWVKA